jgi:ATP-dependent Clp protease ATP-binding subunit ClpC
MFERFTDRARRVVVLAQDEARMLSHNYIGTEHILLGLIHEGEGVAAKALESLGISLEAVRQQVEEIIGQGQQAPSVHIPFTPRAKKVLELSLREALQLGHNYIGTEHILLGLIREGEGVAAQVLVRLGCDLNVARRRVIQLSPGEGAEHELPRFSAAARIMTRSEMAISLKEIADRLASIEAHLGIVRRDGPASAGSAAATPDGGTGTDSGPADPAEPGETSPPVAS